MVSEEVRQQFLSRGIQMVPLDGGAQAALREIEAGAQSDPVVAIGEGPWREVALPAGTPRVSLFGGNRAGRGHAVSRYHSAFAHTTA